jgi:23S rRNA (adenine2503-C2)-methyltransferase
MNILVKAGKPEVAEVYVAMMRNHSDYLVEFVDASDPDGGGRSQKWVIIVSSQFGCPVKCLMCDAGGDFKGNLTAWELQSQIERVFTAHPELSPTDCAKLKIQYARMGEPALNDAVLGSIQWLKERLPNAIPCIATVAPAGRQKWFDRVVELKDGFRDFQMQFSMHSSDQALRDKLMPYPKMSWQWMSDYGKEFFRPGRRKASLNFALCPESPVDVEIIRDHFHPDFFTIKLTPLNPTDSAVKNTFTDTRERTAADNIVEAKAADFERAGFRVVRSVGNMEENTIGSNCGQAIKKLYLEAINQENAPRTVDARCA